MANFNFNKIILGGRLTADPELKTTQSGIAVCTFGIAVSRPKSQNQQDTAVDFITCVAWRNQADFVSQYFTKGSAICVVGRLQTHNFTDQQGVKRYVTEVNVDEVNFVDSKSDNTQQGQYTPPQQAQAKPKPAQQTGYASQATAADVAKFEDMESDDELPF